MKMISKLFICIHILFFKRQAIPWILTCPLVKELRLTQNKKLPSFYVLFHASMQRILKPSNT